MTNISFRLDAHFSLHFCVPNSVCAALGRRFSLTAGRYEALSVRKYPQTALPGQLLTDTRAAALAMAAAAAAAAAGMAPVAVAVDKEAINWRASILSARPATAAAAAAAESSCPARGTARSRDAGLGQPARSRDAGLGQPARSRDAGLCQPPSPGHITHLYCSPHSPDCRRELVMRKCTPVSALLPFSLVGTTARLLRLSSGMARPRLAALSDRLAAGSWLQ